MYHLPIKMMALGCRKETAGNADLAWQRGGTQKRNRLERLAGKVGKRVPYPKGTHGIIL